MEKKKDGKYFQTASLMDEALLLLLEKRDYETITIKEITKKAGVGRSTFYLHYGTIDDLLEETIENSIDKLLEKFPHYEGNSLNGSLDDLYFLKPEYIFPYLEYLEENKRLMKLSFSKRQLFGVDKIFREMNNRFFIPVMDRFGIPKEKQPYVINFYMSGIHAMIAVWINGDCKDSKEFVAWLIIDYCKGLPSTPK